VQSIAVYPGFMRLVVATLLFSLGAGCTPGLATTTPITPRVVVTGPDGTEFRFDDFNVDAVPYGILMP
jgi:hypothetical protein